MLLESVLSKDIFNTTSLVLVSICVIIVSAVLLRSNTPRVPPYNQRQYWESRYAKKPTGYDWYVSFADLSSSNILSTQVLSIPSLRFLEIGCGNSSLAKDIVTECPRIDLVSIDYSDTVINHMKHGIDPTRQSQYVYMDARDMEFKAKSKDYIIDKGTLDAIVSQSSAGSGNNIDAVRVWAEVNRVLSSSATTFLLISCHSASYWDTYASASNFKLFSEKECHTKLSNGSVIKVFCHFYKPSN